MGNNRLRVKKVVVNYEWITNILLLDMSLLLRGEKEKGVEGKNYVVKIRQYSKDITHLRNSLFQVIII